MFKTFVHYEYFYYQRRTYILLHILRCYSNESALWGSQSKKAKQFSYWSEQLDRLHKWFIYSCENHTFWERADNRRIAQ